MPPLQPAVRGAAGFFAGLEWASEENRGLPILRVPPPAAEGAFPWQSVARGEGSPLSLKHTRGVSLYPQERLYQEMAFLAYYLHWSNEALMALDHWERRRWCREVSDINKKLSGDSQKRVEFR